MQSLMALRAARLGVAALVLFSAASISEAAPIELISNGDFETGAFGAWTVTDLGNGGISVDVPGTTTPNSGFPTLGSPANGSFYSVTDQGGPGTHALLQTFVVPTAVTSATLAFDMFVNDQSGAGPIVDPAGLDHTAGANQHARVDILSAGAVPLDTGAGVLGNFYLGVDPGASPHAFTSYSFDISSIVAGGGTFQLRFAEVDNQGFFHQGVDNVSIQAVQAVPEPGTIALLGLGVLGLGGMVARRRRRGLATKTE